MRKNVLMLCGMCGILLSYAASSGAWTARAGTSPMLRPIDQQKDTTPSTPRAATDTSKPAIPPAAVVISAHTDTTKPTTTDTSRVVVIGPKTADSSGTAARQDTVVKPKNDTALILPPDPATLQQQAGQFTLRGSVSENNAPVPGATVINKNTHDTTVTDASGQFQLKASINDTLITKSMGFNDQQVKVEKRTPIDIPLSTTQSTAKTLNTVVVTALGIQKNSRSVGYAIAEIGGNAVQEAKEVNFANALSGKLPGLQVNTNSGSMGGSTKVNMRGTKSILGNNNALFIVDGVYLFNNSTNQAGQLNGGGGYDYGSALADINPEDIANVSVLKGAAATALYGSRGANGVVYLTMKKAPDAEKGIGITYSLNAQMDEVYVLPKYQNLYGGGANGFDTLYYNEHPEGFLSEAAATYDDNNGKGRYDLLPQYSQDASWGPKLNGQIIRPYWSWDKDKGNPDFGKTDKWVAHPNNVKDFYRKGLTLTNNISFAGRDEKGSFRVSYGNMNQTFILANAGLKRNNLAFTGNYNLLKNLHASASVNYSDLRANARPGTGFTGPNPTLQFTMYGQRQLDIEKEKEYAYADGSQLTWNRTSWDNPKLSSSNGPYWNRYRDYEADNRTRTYGFAGLDYEPTKWLQLSGRVFMDTYNTLEEEFTAKDYVAGGYIKRVRASRELNYQFTAAFKKDFSKLFSFNALLGGNIMKRTWSVTGGSTVGGLILPDVYNLQNSAQTASVIDQPYEKQINSGFATAQLGFHNYLFLEISGREDKSSTLKDPYFYPSASLSFVFSDLLKQWKWLDYGKLRTSVSSVGSDTDPYNIYNTYNFLPVYGSFPITSLSTTRNNPYLKPERTREVEVGAEIRFLNDHIGLDFTYYDRHTKDQIIPFNVSPTTGYNATFVNAGEVSNKGMEIGLTLNPIRLKNSFRWDINANIARNRNKLLNLYIDQYQQSAAMVTLGTDRRTNLVSIVALPGQPLGTIMGTDYQKVNGQKLVDASGYYVPTTSTVPIGNVNPDYFGGITNSFSYKGVYLSALLDFQHGGEFFSYTNLYGGISGLLDYTATNNIRENGVVNPGVTADGHQNTTVITAKDHFLQDFGKRISKGNLYDASYWYLREVKLGYDVPENIYRHIGAQRARISLYGRNLWLIHSNAPNVDPSNIINSDSNIQGIEGGALPSVRSFGINLNVSF
ncbi:TonB-linked outer membrane protein, SusC/RagA family [Chitinophaga costaii]|uniref:TonB-linked outer membrane protein, SusC/RagA family n=1 Tax=Chitinophaga costaii TaxID=1335309 RepID=A0A1C4DVL2_9BACT|nr:SusC/RagA family TonB-linked outer membrane protein [Chitinophaga costaii]PUZ27817.1 SusC/RagA family TonB-linked outer membrane protein [Chitinophaga costaii]SCC35310.1 TonB-linked outer membrane protein, SusC/RagA family [Chitinophaga costaii]